MSKRTRRQARARREIVTPNGLITVPPGSPKILIHTRQGKCFGIYCDQPAKVLCVETQDDPRRAVHPSYQAMLTMISPQTSSKLVGGYGTAVDHVLAMAFDDREGTLWIRAVQSQAATTSDIISGQLAVRVKEGGVIEQLQDAGWARLGDEAGNVWLDEIRGKTPGWVKIWRAGKIVQELQIPGHQHGDLLFSDRPGSVYAWTVGGLQHFVADPPEFSQYRLHRLYAVSGIKGAVRHSAYISQGRLVVVTYADRPQRGYFLDLVDLPGR